MTPSALFAAPVFVSNERVIDSGSGKVIKNVAVGTRVRGMALSPDGKRLYAAVSHFRDKPGVTFAPDDRRAYVTCEVTCGIAGTVDVLDTKSQRVIAYISRLADDRRRQAAMGAGIDARRQSFRSSTSRLKGWCPSCMRATCDHDVLR
jgi:DNA-binding beta-propeller fold protein YncE